MQEAKGNIWDFPEQYKVDALCILTNMTVKRDGNLIMGGGQALEAMNRYPLLPKLFGREYTNRTRNGKNLDEIDPIIALPGADHEWTISFPTKYEPRLNSDLGLIERSARSLVKFADGLEGGKYALESILLPRPGCGLGGLNWEKQVRPLLNDLFDDRFLVLTF